jgi:hypothetical protein
MTTFYARGKLNGNSLAKPEVDAKKNGDWQLDSKQKGVKR